ncbi:MAG: preprotein translocase subunit SecG [Planctomycetota bacterium]
MGIILGLSKVIYVLACFLIIVVVLLQQGRGAGVSGLFGGGNADSAFGTRAGTVLGKTTAVLAAIFFVLALFIGAYWGRTSVFSGRKAAPKPAPVKEAPKGVTETVPVPEKKTEPAPASAPKSEGGAAAPAGNPAPADPGAPKP